MSHLLQEEETASEGSVQRDITVAPARVSKPVEQSSTVVEPRKAPEKSVAKMASKKQTHTKMEDSDTFSADIDGGTEEIHRKRRQEYHSRYTEAGFECAFVDEVRVKKLRNTSTVETSGGFPLPLTLSDAIQYGLLKGQTGMFTNPQTSDVLTLGQALKSGFIVPSSAVFHDPMSKRSCNIEEAIDLMLLEQTGHYHVNTNERWNLETLIQKGIVVTRAVPVQEVIVQGSTEFVTANVGRETKSYTVIGAIDPDTSTMVSVGCAIEKGIIDQANGLYNGMDETHQPVSFSISEAVKKGLVKVETSSVFTKDMKSTGPKYIQVTKTFTIVGVIDPDTRQEINVSEAISRGIIDQSKGQYMTPSTGEAMLLVEAISEGLIIAEVSSSSSEGGTSSSNVITTSKRTIYTLTGIVDPVSRKVISVAEALQKGILDQEKGEYRNQSSGETMSVSDAIDQGLVLIERGTHGGTETVAGVERAESICIDDSHEEQAEVTAEEVSEETTTFQITGVRDPINDEVVPYEDALNRGMIDERRGVFVDTSTGETIAISEALSNGLIIGEVVHKTREHNIFHSVIEVGQKDVTEHQPMSVLNPLTGLEIGVTQAVKLGLLSDDRKTYYHAIDDLNIPIEEAIKRGFVNVNPSSFGVAQTRPHVVVGELSSESGEGAATKTRKQRAIVNWSNGTVRDSVTGEEICRDAALARGLIDIKTAALLSRKVETLPFYGMAGDRSSHEVVIMEETTTGEKSSTTEVRVIQTDGTELATSVKQRDDQKEDGVTMTIQTTQLVQQIPDHVVVEESDDAVMSEPASEDVSGVLSFEKAVKLGLFSLQSRRFRDPSTGDTMTLQVAIGEGFIDLNSVALVNIVNGESLTLLEACRVGLIDQASGKIDELQAQRDGIVLDPQFTVNETQSPPPMNLLDAIMVQLLDSDTARFTHPVSGSEMSLHEAVSRNLISGSAVVIMDPNSGRNTTLEAALRTNVINGKSGDFIDTSSGKKLFSLKDAVRSNLVESAYREETAEVRDHNSGDVVSLEWAIKTAIIDSDSPVVYDPDMQCRISTKEATKKGLMNGQSLTYNSTTGQALPVTEAARLTLIVPVGAPVLAKGTGISHLMQTLHEKRDVDEKLTKIEEQISERFLPMEHIDSADMRTIDNGVVEIRRPPEEMKSMDAATHIAPVTVTVDGGGVKVAHAVKMVVEKNRFSETLTETRLPGRPEPSETYKSPAATQHHPAIGNVTIHDSAVVGPQTTHRPIRVADVDVSICDSVKSGPKTDHRPIRVADVDVSICDSIKNGSKTAYRPIRVADIDVSICDSVKSGPETAHRPIRVADVDVSHICDSVKSGPETAHRPIRVADVDVSICDSVKSGPKTAHRPIRVADVDVSICDSVKRGPKTAHRPNKVADVDVSICDSVKSGPKTAHRPITVADVDVSICDSVIIGSKTARRPNVSKQPAFPCPVTTKRRDEVGGVAKHNLVNIDWQTGEIIDSVTKELLSPGEALELGLVDMHIAQLVEKRKKLVSETIPSRMTLNEAATRGLLIIPLGRITNPATRQRMTVEEAIDIKFLDAEHSVIINPATGQRMTVRDAIDGAIMDAHSGDVKDTATGKTLTLTEMSLKGYIPEHGIISRPTKAAPMKERGLMNTDSKEVLEVSRAIHGYLVATHEVTEETVTDESPVMETTIRESVQRRDVPVALDRAVQMKLIDMDSGTFCEPNTGETMSLAAAIVHGYIIAPEVKQAPSMVAPEDQLPFEEAMRRGLIDIKNNTFTEPITEVLLPLDAAIRQGYLLLPEGGVTVTITEHTQSQTLERKKKKKTVSFAEAVEERLIDLETAEYIDPETTHRRPLRDAINDRLINPHGAPSPPGTPITITEAVERGLFDAHTGMFVDDVTGRQVSLMEAVSEGYINGDTIYYDTNDACVFTLEHGLNDGRIDMRTGHYVDARTSRRIPIDEAASTGLMAVVGSPILSGIAITEALKRGADSRASSEARNTPSETVDISQIRYVFDPCMQCFISADEAKQRGIVDWEHSEYVDVVSGQRMQLHDALASGLVSTSWQDELTTSSQVTVSKSLLERGHTERVTIVGVSDAKTGQRLSVQDAIEAGLFNEQAGQYIHPLSGDVLTLEQAIDAGLVLTTESLRDEVVTETVSYNIVSVMDTMTGQYITPEEAAVRGILNIQAECFTDRRSDQRMTLTDALKRGLIQVEPLSTSAGDINEERATVTTTMTNLERQTYRIKGVLNPVTKEMMHPREAIRCNILDLPRGLYVNPQTGETIHMHEAYAAGYIIAEEVEVFDSVPQTVTYAIRGVWDPRIKEEVGTKEAIEEGLLDQEMSKYTNVATGEMFSIKEAIELGYVFPEGSAPPSLAVFGNTKSYTIKSVIDPRSGEEIPISDAVRHQIVDKVKAEYWNMKTDERISIDEAIMRGLVNIKRVEDSAKREELVEAAAKVYSLKWVTDPCTGEKYNPIEAERRGLINKIQGIYMDPVSGMKMSIRDAIAQGYIEAEELEEPDYDELPEDVTTYATLQAFKESEVTHISLVIDVATGEEISVMEAVRRGIIDPVGGVYTVPLTGETLVLSEALQRGFVRTNRDPGHTVQMMRTVNVTSVIDPQTGRQLAPAEAARLGVLDMQNQCIVVDHVTGQTISLTEAENRGLLVTESGSTPALVPSKGVEFTVETATTYVTSTESPSRKSREHTPQNLRNTASPVAPGRTSREHTPQNLRNTASPVAPGRTSREHTPQNLRNTAIPAAPGRTSREHTPQNLRNTASPVAPGRTSREHTPQNLRNTANRVAPSAEPVTFTEAVKMGLIDSERNLFLCSATQERLPVAEAVQFGLLIGDIPARFEQQHMYSDETATQSREAFVRSSSIQRSGREVYDNVTEERVDNQTVTPTDDAGTSSKVIITKTTTVDRVTLKPDGTIIRNDISERRAEDEQVAHGDSHVTTHSSMETAAPSNAVSRSGVAADGTRLGAYMTQPGFVMTTEGHVLNVTTGARMSFEQGLVHGLIEVPRDQLDSTVHDRTISDMSVLASSTEDVVS